MVLASLKLMLRGSSYPNPKLLKKFYNRYISTLKKNWYYFLGLFQGIIDVVGGGRNGTILTRANYPGPVSIF